METFFTLNTLIDDIMLTIRNNNITESEDVSRKQIEQWIHYYRAMLIKQDLDKGRDVNGMYVQTIHDIPLRKIDISEHLPITVKPEYIFYKIENELPQPIDLHYGTGILYVSDILNNPIQNMSRGRRAFQHTRKYSPKDTTYYYERKFIYVQSPKPIDYICVMGVWEDPTQLGLDSDERYPMPASMIPSLKQLIIEKEFGVMLRMPTDTVNDTTLNTIKNTDFN